MNQVLKENIKENKNLKVVPITITLISAGFFCMLNETVLNMALKTLMQQFNISANTVQWLSTGYMLIMGISIPLSAFLTKKFTTRQLFLTSVAIFLLGTIISSIAPIFSILLAGRLIQAVGTGVLIPNIINTLLIIYPIRSRGKILGVFNLVMFCAPAIGPTLSGLVLQFLNWRWLFLVIIPFSFISFIAGYLYMQNVTKLENPSLDIISVLLSTIGFGGFIYGVNNIGVSSTAMTIPIIIGCVALFAFVLRQFHMDNPMLDIRLFKYPMFTIGTILIIIMHMVNFATMLILPMFLEGALGLTAFGAGLVMLPGGFINGIVSPISGHLYDKFGPKTLILPGFIISALVFLIFSFTISSTITIPLIIALHCLSLLAVGLINTPTQTNSLNQLSLESTPHGTAIMNTLQQIAGAFGTSLFVAIMSASQKDYLNSVGNINDPSAQTLSLVYGVHHVFIIQVCVLIFAVILASFLKHKPNRAKECTIRNSTVIEK
ncbi:DHA2 family efflux MFS transporter permease subunit [Clostridium sp. SHJSY1]|uniref:MDR family MFS transporter n=1 Tax=Clostridium sp. SHJSY1 TaxID=2942483 RepID=UPI0028769178|nr:MDR family MFS transporter [Clostridium sp. SHJSY1]MDS0528042.1 DHA2 family efflux MFS transporter permease subunit [Clostridium sp. SHJSY1]